MKVLNKVVIGMASLVLLTACAPKCSYAQFHEKAVAAAEKDSGYTKAVVNGTAKNGNTTYEFKNVELKVTNGRYDISNVTLSELANYTAEQIAAYGMIGIEAKDVAEKQQGDEQESQGTVTYYAGSTFKLVVKDDKNSATYTWNKFGLLTSLKSSGETETNLKVKWSK